MRMDIIVLLFIQASIQLTVGQPLRDVNKLYDDLFANYRKGVTPRINQSLPFEIEFAFYLQSLTSFQEIKETLALVAGIHMVWTDVSLSWDPNTYGGIQSIDIPSSDIWLPKVYLMNNAEEVLPIGGGQTFQVQVTSDGSVVFISGGIMKAKCPTDLSTFPFDTQTCTLSFQMWGVESLTYKFSTQEEEVIISNYITNAQWTLKSTQTFVDVSHRQLYKYKVTLILKREPVYYVAVVVVPCLIFCLLNPLVFILKVESGERISLSMTMLLSYVIFLTLVCNSIPASANPMCFLLVMMIIIIAISGLIVVFAIVSVNYYFEESCERTLIVRFIRKTAVFKTRNMTIAAVTEDGKENSNHGNHQLMTGKELSSILDMVFLCLSYALIGIVLGIYTIYVLA